MEPLVRAIVGTCFIVVMLIGLSLNILLLVAYAIRKQFHQPSKYFVASMAVVDILSIACWTSFSAVSAYDGNWILPVKVCELQEFTMSFCLLINMHTFMILSLERGLFLIKPSRHSEICVNTVIVILLSALWLFDGLISIFPFLGWGEITYFENQFQCSMDYEKNTRQMRFVTAVAIGIPFLVMVIAYIIIFLRLRKLQNSVEKGGQIIIEQADFANGDSYAARLKRQQLKFKNAGLKTKKPVLGREVDKNGYVRDDSSDDDSTNVPKKGKSKVQNIYYLYKSDVSLTKTYLVVSVTYILLWLPYVVLTYIFTYDRYHGIPDAVFYIFVILIHCTAFIKPVIYVIQNENFQGHFGKVFNKIYKKIFQNNKYRDMERN